MEEQIRTRMEQLQAEYAEIMQQMKKLETAAIGKEASFQELQRLLDAPSSLAVVPPASEESATPLVEIAPAAPTAAEDVTEEQA